MGEPEDRRVPTPAPDAGAWCAAWAFVALALLCWWLRAPYAGLSRDAEFYALDALRHADPGFLTGDLYFAHGTQGRYSLFIAPYAALVQALGVQSAALLTTTTLRLLWLTGVWRLMRGLAPAGSAAVWGFGAVLLVDGVYHPMGVFRFGEPFATSRLAAETVSLFALGALVGGRAWVARGLAALAAALHPLLGWPALALVALDAGRRRAGGHPIPMAAGLLAVLGAAAALGLPLAERLLQRYDPVWWDWVADRNAITVVQAWPLARSLDLLAWLPLLALSAHGRRDAAATLARRCAGIATLALGVWLLGCLTHAVLPIQLQPWRVLWLVQLLAAGMWALRLADLDWRRTDTWILALLLLARPVAVTGWQWPLVLMLGLRLWQGPRIDARLAPRLQLGALSALLLLWVVPAAAPVGALPDLGSGWADRLYAPLVAVAGLPARRLAVCLLLPLAALGWSARTRPSGRPTRRWPAPLAALACGSGTLALWLALAWHELAPPERWIRALQDEIPPGTVVHWDQRARLTWFELQRPAWLVSEHGAPLLFFRGLAMDWNGRIARARALELDIPSIRRTRGGGPVTGTHRLDLARAHGLCADPRLGVVLLEGVVTGADRVLRLPARSPLSLVDCQHHRDGSPSAVSGPP